MTIRIDPYGLRCGLPRLREFWPSQLHAASLGALKSVPRSRRDHRALLLRQGCEQMQDEGVNVGAKLGNDELYALSHQLRRRGNDRLIAKSYSRIIVQSCRFGNPMIIGVLNRRGGVGKTTLAINLAVVFAQAGSRLLLVDADPQGSALAWSAVRERDPLFPVVGMAKPSLHKDIPELARDYDTVVIDGAPRVNELGRAAIMASDLIVIPVQPTPYDVWAAANTAMLVNEVRQFKDGLRAVFVVNRKIVNTAIARDVSGALAGFGFPVSDVALCQRVIYAESAAQGLAVTEAEPNSEAAREITRLAESLDMVEQMVAA